ncbi:hypothetical protein MPSEU_000707200 [Mayamaea pseudoterrestris]|nr:hypothetical protein MPSEU_000707200 [Mayamaea pseudoterrestris]
MKRTTDLIRAAVSLIFTTSIGNCFIVPKHDCHLMRQRQTLQVVTSSPPRRTTLSLVDDWTSLTTGIEYFDGSQLVDTVVVSNVFWSSLLTKLVSLVVGQVVATIVFGIIATLAARQIGNIGSFISDKVFKREKTFRKMPDLVTDRIIQPDFGKLVICIVIDSIGSSSALIPILGEATDVLWAPIAGLLLRSLYSSNILFGLEFAEEILPFTDILPLATICWVVDTYFAESPLAQLLNIGSYSTKERADYISAIDVFSEPADETQLKLTDTLERRDGSRR